jgi:hypothetical protein
LIIKTLRRGIEDMNVVSNKTMWRSLVSSSWDQHMDLGGKLMKYE